MKATLVTKFLMAGLSLIAMSVYADTPSSTSSLAGNYKCQRAGTSYTLTISSTGDTYTLEWDDSTGNPVMYGTGVVDAKSSVLSSSYWNIANTDSGIESWAIKSDGSLQSNWLSQSGKDNGTETCTKS